MQELLYILFQGDAPFGAFVDIFSRTVAEEKGQMSAEPQVGAGDSSDSDSSAPNTTSGGGASTAGSGGWVTRCVCGRNNEQEGFMIECEGCEVWQHGHCVGVTKNNVPKHYYCERCKPEMHPLPQAKKPVKPKGPKRKRTAKPKVASNPTGSKKAKRANDGPSGANEKSEALTQPDEGVSVAEGMFLFVLNPSLMHWS